MKGSRHNASWRAGWSLIELLGVMAIISVIALALAPALLRQIIQVNRNAEQEVLEQLAKGLKSAILKHHYIPDEKDFVAVIARELGWSEEKVRYNRIKQERVFLIDPQLKLGPNGSGLSYTQTWAGSYAPTNARVLFISSLSVPLPTTIKSGRAQSEESFEAIWNAGLDQVPSGWTWSGEGADLRIQRVHLEPLFVRLTLNNNYSISGRFSVDEEQTDHELPSSPFERYYIISTRLKLRGVDGNVQTVEVLRDPCMFIFEDGVWRGRSISSWESRRLVGTDLQEALNLFMSVTRNTNVPGLKNFDATFRANVSNYMVAYLNAYIDWANRRFPNDPQTINQLQKLAKDLANATSLKP